MARNWPESVGQFPRSVHCPRLEHRMPGRHVWHHQYFGWHQRGAHPVISQQPDERTRICRESKWDTGSENGGSKWWIFLSWEKIINVCSFDKMVNSHWINQFFLCFFWGKWWSNWFFGGVPVDEAKGSPKGSAEITKMVPLSDSLDLIGQKFLANPYGKLHHPAWYILIYIYINIYIYRSIYLSVYLSI